MPNLQASPRSDLLGFIADKLKSGKSFGNEYEILKQIPLLGGTGLGDLFLGKSPELADDMSYNLSSAVRGGNRATGGIGTYTLDKRSADLGMVMADMYGLSKGLTSLGKYGAKKLIDKSGFDETRRAFLEGKAKGKMEPTNEAISTSIDAINEVLQKPISRRNVLKGTALAGGVAAAPSLLRNFAKEAEHTIPKVAEHSVDNVVNSGIKHKYNTLAEYFDDVHKSFSNQYQDDLYKSHFTARLKRDEEIFNIAKSGKNTGMVIDNTGKYPTLKHDFKPIKAEDNTILMYDNVSGHVIDPTEKLMEFSPKAKQEMKNWKTQHGDSWNDFSSDRSLDLYELGRGFYQ